MHLYFKNNWTLNTSWRSNQGYFEVKVKIGEAKTIEKSFFSRSGIKIVSTTIILVLKLVHKEYQRNKFTFSVKNDED